MLSTKVVEDEYELRYYKGYINTTIFYESLISTWQATIAAEVAKFKETSNENDKTTELLENDVNSDEIACKDILQKVMIGIEPMIRSYLEIPKNIDTNHMGSENYESLKEEVANLELELRRQKVYTALLNQRLEEIMVAAKLAEKISHLFITESDKINDKTFTLHELDALMAMIKSGEDVLERLLPLEKKTTSYHLYSSFVKHVLLGVPIGITFFDVVGYVARVDGISMQPALNPDKTVTDYVFLNRWAVRSLEVQRGDIISLVSPKDPEQKIIKRVVGIQGDIIATLGYKRDIVRIPEGHCWVEGDHTGHSMDSNNFGPVSLGLITAKASYIVWPPSRWHRIESQLPTSRVPLNQKPAYGIV